MWKIGAVANLVIFASYMAIALAIFAPLAKSRQLRVNRLGRATGIIFLTCGAGHGLHLVHLLLPSLGLAEREGLALRSSWDWHLASWDALTAVVGVYYWSLRKSYGSFMRGAKLFEDIQERQQQALEINDNIVQGLTVAKLALETGHGGRSLHAIQTTLASAQGIITHLLDGGRLEGGSGAFAPGQLRRKEAAEAQR